MRRVLSNSRLGSGIGYIFLPSDVSRDDYVESCFRKERVSVLIEDGGGVIHNCPITKQALRDIEFPKEFEIDGKMQIGSTVIFVMDINSDVPLIVGVIANVGDSTNLGEGKFNLFKTLNGNYVFISGDAKTGTISINSISGGDFGELSINVINSNKNSKLNINVSGEINIFAEQSISVGTNNGDINLKPGNKLNIGKENLEPIPLGDKTKEVLSDIKGVLSSLNTKLIAMSTTDATVAANLSLAGLAGLAGNLSSITTDITSVSTKINKILSKVSTTE